MIYFISKQQIIDNFTDDIKQITVEESLDIISKWGMMLQYDSETGGRDPHLCKLLCAQIGNIEGTDQIVIDCTTIDIMLYKGVLETHYLICHNGKFDLQFLYNYGIIPRLIYDTMIVEQFLYLGYPKKGEYGGIGFSLKDVAERRLGINIDKTVRGEIIWRGLDLRVIKYAAGDVVYLGAIMKDQRKDLIKIPNSLVGAKLECDFVPAIAYLEWCGIHLNQEKWKAKMQSDENLLKKAREALDTFIETDPKLKEFTKVNLQGDLFNGFDTKPHCTINWSSDRQVVKLAKKLGFNVSAKDKKTGKVKESVTEKVLAPQKGINDTFLKLYSDYQEHFKVCSSFGQGHINAVNPITDRIHTTFHQLGAASGRMSCGSDKPNIDLAKFKELKQSECTYPNIQQLPADEATRGAFTAPEGYEWCSCDFSALESRLGADIYNEKHMIDEFLNGSGDIHSLMALTFFEDQMEQGTTTKEVKKKYPDLRKKAKSPEFLIQFGGSAYGLAAQLAIPESEAQKYVDSYYNKFKGIADFKKKGSEFVRKNGYVVICQITGHRMYWWDHKEWFRRQQSYTSEFWDEYKANHKGTGDYVAQEVSMHFRAASKWDRMALNAPTQGTGSIILKRAITNFYNWIIDNGYFNKVELSALVHDEANIIYPISLHNIVPVKLQECMEESASYFCKKLPIPAEPAVGDHWIH